VNRSSGVQRTLSGGLSGKPLSSYISSQTASHGSNPSSSFTQTHPHLSLKPTLIFHGQGRISQAERDAYHPGVNVHFSSTAYNNGKLFLEWIDKELKPILEGDTMLVMDVATFHKTDAVRNRLKNELPHYVLPTMIPGGLTCLVQPLDTAVNSMYKKLLQDRIDQYVTDWEKRRGEDNWTVKDKRIMLTHVVAEAWVTVYTDKKPIQIRSFLNNGISINPDGSENHLIKIKGIDNKDIVWDGWEEAVDVTIKMGDHEELPPDLDNIPQPPQECRGPAAT
jgi:hypothetical protein